MTQQIDSPPEKPQKRILPSRPDLKLGLPRKGGISLLTLITLLLVLFTVLLLQNAPQLTRSPATIAAATVTQNDTSPLQMPGGAATPALQLPGGHFVIYEQQDRLYRASTTGGEPQLIDAPGYVYNRAVPPLITGSGQLLYSGDGLWLTDIFKGNPQRIAAIPPDQTITSLVLSSDRTTVAWSTEPKSGNGAVNIYAGPLGAATLVYRHATTDCPCFRVFSFLHGVGEQGHTTLLLSDDRGDHHAIRYGLWSLDLMRASGGNPQPLLETDTSQLPLQLAPRANILLYSSHTGIVPLPTNGSAPDDIAALDYANDLLLTTLKGKPLAPGPSQVVLPAQRESSNSADYRWILSPRFSSDGRTLVYVQFASDAQAPFERHSVLYTVHLSGDGSHIQIDKPQLLANASTGFIELGAWLNDHILTFYADNSLYALDVQSGAVATIAQIEGYGRVVAVVE